jgi:hypothetical protein
MTMPAGKYYIGDLCYVLHERWDEFCNLTINGQNVLDGEFNLKDGTRFATFTTRWGDGTYEDQHGNEYGVDAGLIGCVRIEDIDLTNPENFLHGGNLVEFVNDFSTFSAGGVITIGNIVIDTDVAENYDQEEEDE